MYMNQALWKCFCLLMKAMTFRMTPLFFDYGEGKNFDGLKFMKKIKH